MLSRVNIEQHNLLRQTVVFNAEPKNDISDVNQLEKVAKLMSSDTR